MILKINDRIKLRTIDFFNEFRLNLKHDSVASTFSFKFYFDPRNKEHAELACVSHFHEAIIEHNGQKLITGYILSNAFNTSSKKELVEVGGYSKPGVLEDCDIPTSLYPLQTDGLTLKEITEKLIKPFGIGLVVDADVNTASTLAFTSASDPTLQDGLIEEENSQSSFIPSFSLSEKVSKKIDKANADNSQNIKSYLTMLAAQRNVLLSHDAEGRLLFTEAKTNQKPITYFNAVEGALPSTTMSLSFNGQAMHSHITVMGEAQGEDGNASEFTIRNPYVPILYRPKVVAQVSGTDVTVQETARQALSAELKNIVLTINTDRWDIDGKLILPNNLVSVFNPECFIYEKTDWFIEEVTYTGDAKKMIATLKCVPPEVYNKKEVKNIFVNPHENLPRF